MKQDLARGRPLQRIADFALGGAAGLLGSLLLGATVIHLLAPVAVRTPDLEPAAFVTTVGSLYQPPIRMSGVAKARPAHSHASSGSASAAHRSGAKRAKPRALELRREPAHTLQPAPLAAHTASHPVLRIVHVTHSVPMAAHVAYAALPIARRRTPHGASQVARLLRGGGRAADGRTTASRLRFSAKAMQPPLGYNVRASLALVPIDALPAAPVTTTPVRGRVPPSSPSTAAALERRQDVALPSP